MFHLSALRTNIPSPVSNYSADYSLYPSTPPTSPTSYASTLFEGTDHLLYPMDIDTIQCPPSSLHMSDLDSCLSTPPSQLPPSINKRPNIVPLPLLDPEEEAEHAELEEFRKACEMGNTYLSGRVSNLSKKVTAYAHNFLTDWLMSQKEENPINDWDSKISSQPSWTGTASSTSSPPSYKSEKHKLQEFNPSEDTDSPGEGWFCNPRSDQVGLPFLIKYKGYWVEAPWVTYNFSPTCPQFLASMGKNHPIQAQWVPC
jgi:hypothetical protein